MRVTSIALAAIVIAATTSALPAAAEQAMAMPVKSWSFPVESTFTTPGHCPELARRQTLYRVCDDQREIFHAALEEARRNGRLLLVTFGSTWCPGCRSFSAQLEQAANVPASVPGRFTRVEIAVSTLSDGRRVPVPTGQEVLQHVLAAAPGANLRGVPFLAVIDPREAGGCFARNLDDTEVAAGGAFDMTRIATILAEADNHLRNGGTAPAEPGWLRRKLRRWFNI